MNSFTARHIAGVVTGNHETSHLGTLVCTLPCLDDETLEGVAGCRVQGELQHVSGCNHSLGDGEIGRGGRRGVLGVLAMPWKHSMTGRVRGSHCVGG